MNRTGIMNCLPKKIDNLFSRIALIIFVLTFPTVLFLIYIEHQTTLASQILIYEIFILFLMLGAVIGLDCYMCKVRKSINLNNEELKK